MKKLRFYFGVYVAGPIVGLSSYLLSIKPMYAAANRIAGIRYYNTNDIDKIEMGLNGFAPRPK